ncbi:MAG: hypothetical protein H8K05_01275 [Nitrospira sp.]|nr:hypothetical protein [Nitrospira sp.]
MLSCFAHTRSKQVASDHLRVRFGAMTRELGFVDLLQGELGDLFDQAFALPTSDPQYRSNRLQPGALSLEWSFSEAELDALRFEFQPFDPTLAGEERLRRTVRALARIVQGYHGRDLAERFMSAVQRVSAAESKLNFGAFVGLVQRPRCDDEFKIYVECDPEDPALLSSELSNIAGTVPHFVSVAVCTSSVSQRIYYICRDGLRAMDLEAVCAALGMSHRFPGLLMTMLELTEGHFHLPPNSVLLGIRRHGKESELKVELVCGSAMSPDGLIDRIDRLLQPTSVAPFRRWVTMICPETVGTLPARVVSVNASASQPPRLSVYAAEPWIE